MEYLVIRFHDRVQGHVHPKDLFKNPLAEAKKNVTKNLLRTETLSYRLGLLVEEILVMEKVTCRFNMKKGHK